eukprot:950349-Prymnesium_polylepis.1
MLPKPRIELARAAAMLQLLLQKADDKNPGDVYPLYTPLATFDRFGTDVSQYMHFVYRATRVFLVLFLLNLSNI